MSPIRTVASESVDNLHELEQTVGAALDALEGMLGTVQASERPREA